MVQEQYEIKSALGKNLETLAEEDDEGDVMGNSLSKTDRTEEDQNTDRDQD